MLHFIRRATALSSIVFLASIGAAVAQDASGAGSETVVVTGSRIRVSPLTATTPVIQLDQSAIEKTGLSSTADVLQALPLAGGGLNAKFNNSGNFGNPPDGGGVGAGAAEIDLRYLGSRRVLVLVDGLRWVPGSSASGVPGAVDLNTIPFPMISHIEVLQEGASPIYGSDAIAGVVNIITKTSQDGLQASAQWGQYGQGDGDLTDVQASWGASLNRTSIVAGVGYFNQDGVSSNDRDISRFPAPFANSCLAGGCSSATPFGRFLVHDPNTGKDLNMTLSHAFPPGGFPTYNPADPTGPGEDFRGFTTADRFNFQPFNFVVTPSERVGMFAHIRHDFTDWLWLKVLATYVDRKSVNQAAPLPLFVGPDSGNGNLLDTVKIDVTNPFNPFGFTLDPSTYSFIGRRMIENGPRHFEQDVNTWDITSTLGGQVTLADRTFYWDVNAVWARNHADQRFTGNLNAANVAQALGPVALCTAPCVPFNIFGGVGTITPEMLKFIAFVEHDTSEQTLHDYSANVTGDLFSLPAGPMGIAAGYEHRENKGFFQPDAIVAAGLSSDIPAQPTKGSIDVDEFYTELNVPILADMPMFHKLDLSVAGRWFDYSTSGSDSTYKVGLQWRVIEEFLLRGSWGQGFRAPSIGELFGSASRFDQQVDDPCSDMLGLQGGPAQPANVRANCIAHGVPASGSYAQINPQLPVFTSGNPALTPETSVGWTYGAVWEPSFLKDNDLASNASIEVVYSDIKLDGAIQAQNAATLLQRCAQTGDALACSTITRTSSGAISGIHNPLTNIGGIRTKAMDVNLLYYSPEWSWGQLSAHWYSTFLFNFDELVPIAVGFTTISREGTERGSPDQAFPRVKSTFGLDWDNEDFGATATVRYLASVRESQVDNKLGSRTYFDAQLRWTPPFVENRFQVAVGVNNAFDQDPPGCISCGLNNFDPNAYDPPGRFFYARISYKE